MIQISSCLIFLALIFSCKDTSLGKSTVVSDVLNKGELCPSDITHKNYSLKDSDSLKIRRSVVFKKIKGQDISESKIKKINIAFTHGFDQEENFKVFLNNKKIKDCFWKSNFIIDDTSGGEAFHKSLSFYIDVNESKRNAFRVEINHEYIEFILPDDVCDYHLIGIDRLRENWRVTFENLSKIIQTEIE